MADEDDKKGGGCPGATRDLMHLGPDIGNGLHPFVRHRPGCNMEAGFITPSKPSGNDEAAPRCDGIVRLTHSGPGPVFDVESLYEREAPTDVAGSRDGPAMVATDAFRSGWDRIFGVNKTIGQA